MNGFFPPYGYRPPFMFNYGGRPPLVGFPYGAPYGNQILFPAMFLLI